MEAESSIPVAPAKDASVEKPVVSTETAAGTEAEKVLESVTVADLLQAKGVETTFRNKAFNIIDTLTATKDTDPFQIQHLTERFSQAPIPVRPMVIHPSGVPLSTYGRHFMFKDYARQSAAPINADHEISGQMADGDAITDGRRIIQDRDLKHMLDYVQGVRFEKDGKTYETDPATLSVDSEGLMYITTAEPDGSAKMTFLHVGEKPVMEPATENLTDVQSTVNTPIQPSNT